MRIRKLRWVLVALAVFAVVVSLVALWPRGRITRVNFDRIQLGTMTLAEVEAILGPSNLTQSEMIELDLDDFDSNAQIIEGRIDANPLRQENDPHRWLGGAGGIAIMFEDGHAAMKVWCPRVHPLQRFLRWLQHLFA